MRKFLLGATALLGISGAAVAADLNVLPKAPTYQVQGINWSGIYVGIHGGWEWSAFDPGFSTSPNVVMLTNPGVLGANASGGFVGGHIGLNIQQGNWVLGPRVDFDLSGLQGSQTDTLGTSVVHSIPWHGDVVGKLGYLVAPQVLLYAVGGVAFGEIKDGASIVQLTPNLLCPTTVTSPTMVCGLSNENVHVGWTAGLGLEYAINSNILIGIEWDYTNLGHHGVTFNGPATSPVAGTFNVDDKAAWNSVKGNLTFKF